MPKTPLHWAAEKNRYEWARCCWARAEKLDKSTNQYSDVRFSSPSDGVIIHSPEKSLGLPRSQHLP